jgi:Uma2 family endonuclease
VDRKRVVAIPKSPGAFSKKEIAVMSSKSKGFHDVQEGMTGEIIEGELFESLEPSWKHHVAALFKDDILAPYSSEKEDDPGGWAFLLQPKIELGESILVPDLAGWKITRLPALTEIGPISVVPDWVCEILSEDTARLDKTRKMPVYARNGLSHLWLVDPQRKSLGLLQAYKLDHESGRWIWLGGFWGDEEIGVEPFDEVGLQLGAAFHKLAFIGARARAVPKAEIISRLRATLEAGPSRLNTDDKPEDDPTSQD